MTDSGHVHCQSTSEKVLLQTPGRQGRGLGESSWLFEQELGLLSTSHSIYQPSESPSTRPSSLPFLKTGVVCATRSMGTPALATFNGQSWTPGHETRLTMTEP